jgi:hypothetical protein
MDRPKATIRAIQRHAMSATGVAIAVTMLKRGPNRETVANSPTCMQSLFRLNLARLTRSPKEAVRDASCRPTLQSPHYPTTRQPK